MFLLEALAMQEFSYYDAAAQDYNNLHHVLARSHLNYNMDQKGKCGKNTIKEPRVIHL